MMMMSALKQVLIFGVGFVVALGLSHFNTKTKTVSSSSSYLPPQSHININYNTTTNRPYDDDGEPINASGGRPYFDYFLFVLKWPAAFCNIQRNKHTKAGTPPPKQCHPYPLQPKHTDKFTIHGLWPQLNTAEAALFCKPAQQMTDNDIAAVVNDGLLDYWPDLFDAGKVPPLPNFWTWEWHKHGKCSSTKAFGPQQYLRTAIDLAKTHAKRIFDGLGKLGIKPDGTSVRRVEDIREAVKKITGYYPTLNIQLNDSGERLLLEIHLCVEKDGKTLFDCDPDYRFAHP